MKNYLIKWIKKNRFLYRNIKKIMRMIRKQPTIQEPCQRYMCVYIMNDISEFSDIYEHFQQYQTPQYHLVVVVKGYVESIHTLIQNNLDITFLSLDYFENYHQKFNIESMLLMDYHQDNQIMDYIV